MSNESRNDLIRIGLRLRHARKALGLTLDVLAGRTGLSKGLLSRVENFRAVPSLPVLAGICQSLNLDMGDVVKGIGVDETAPYTLVRLDDREVIQREDSVGFIYESMVSRSLDHTVFESFMLTVEPHAKRKPVTAEGHQMIFVLEGEADFKLGLDTIALGKGDTIFFDGRIPHVMLNHGSKNAKFLAIYLLNKERTLK